MITRADIVERVREWGLAEQVVEKDYVLGWVLWGIGSDALLGQHWGIPRRRPGGPGPAGESASLVELYGQGWSGPHLSILFGCSTATVYRRLEAAGVARRRQPPAIDRPGLLEALDAGLSAPDIAARFDVSVSAVCRALAREGLQTASQAARRHAAENYAALLEVAERSGTVDRATIDSLRRRVRPAPTR